MPSPKSQRFGAVVATRYRDGTCAAACNRGNCRAYAEPRRWRRTRRLAREHAAAHAATDARDVDTPWGTPAHELPRANSTPHRRLGAVAAVLLLAVLAFGVTVSSVAGRAGSAPTPTTIAPAPHEYLPTPAGPPSSSSSGGDR